MSRGATATWSSADDWLLVGYLETDDFGATQRRIAAEDVSRRWRMAVTD